MVKNLENEHNRIEDDLNQKLLGEFRMAISSFDFEWKGSDTTDQRRVSHDHVKKMLQAFQETGLRRCLPEHHITATIPRQVFDEAVQATIKNTGVNSLIPKQRNANNNGGDDAASRYPALVMPAGVMIEAQSGQHRIHALRELFQKEPDRWWIVRLYDSGQYTFFFADILVDIYSLTNSQYSAPTYS